MNANKPPAPAETKGAKLNNGRDLDVDSKKEEPSFFGSFFSAAKNAPKKKGAAIMDSVKAIHCAIMFLSSHKFSFSRLPLSVHRRH